MAKKGFDPTLINAYTRFCENMALEMKDGSTAITNVGVVQGGVTSPTSFAIMIDPMLRALNEHCPTLALADDIICIVKGELKLHQLIVLLGEQCQERSFTVNKKKSAIMEIRLDKR